jgi:hypothetical protein
MIVRYIHNKIYNRKKWIIEGKICVAAGCGGSTGDLLAPLRHGLHGAIPGHALSQPKRLQARWGLNREFTKIFG